MSSESRLSILNSVINDLIGVAGKAENTRIYPNAEVIDAAPADLPADYIIIVDEDGFYTPAVKVAGLTVSAGDFVNILYIKGTEPIAFQQGSEGTPPSAGGWPFFHVLTVDPTDVDADYPTIQDACNAAVDGDAIFIGASAYSEQVTITKSLTLIALGLVTLTYNTSPTLTLNGSGKTIYLEGLKVYNTDDAGDSIALQITDCQSGTALHCEFIGSGAGSANNCIGANMATGTPYTFDDTILGGENGVISSVGLKTDGTAYIKNCTAYASTAGLYIDTNGTVTINDSEIDDGIINNGTLIGSYIDGSNNIIIVTGNELNTDTINETTAAAGVTVDGALLKDNFGNASAWAFLAKNTSGGAAATNDVGYINEDGEYKTTTTANLDAAWCVVVTGGANGADIYVANRGRVTVVLNGNCSAGDYLYTSTTATQAAPLAYIRPEVFAVALTANAGGAGGTCSALLLCNRAFSPYQNTNDIIYIQNASLSDFVSTLNGAPVGANITYNAPTSGSGNAIAPTSTTELGKILLCNTTKAPVEYARIIAVNTGTSTITVSNAADIATWLNGETITTRSQVNTDAISSAYFYDIELSTVFNRAVGIAISCFFKDSGAANIIYRHHPYETGVTSKRMPIYTQVTNQGIVSYIPSISIINYRYQIHWTASGVGTVIFQDRIIGIIEAAP